MAAEPRLVFNSVGMTKGRGIIRVVDVMLVDVVSVVFVASGKNLRPNRIQKDHVDIKIRVQSEWLMAVQSPWFFIIL